MELFSSHGHAFRIGDPDMHETDGFFWSSPTRSCDSRDANPPVCVQPDAHTFGHLAGYRFAHRAMGFQIFEGTPLHLDMKAVLDKIAASLEGEVTLEPDWFSEHVDVLPEDRVRIDPDLWGHIVGFVEKREIIRARYQTFDGREFQKFMDRLVREEKP